jgi:WD40 repeat protein
MQFRQRAGPDDVCRDVLDSCISVAHHIHRTRTRTQGHTSIVTSVAWSPDGRQLASGSADNSIRVWDAESGKSVATLQVR